MNIVLTCFIISYFFAINMIRPVEFIHPHDAAALRQLEGIPGFGALVKKIMQLGLEQMRYGVNMASNIRLSPTQLPKLYNRLPRICQKLGIEEPEFYLEMDPAPNAYTYGDSRIFITITSGLVELLDDDELDAVIAHECGHILCRHVLYHSIAEEIFKGAGKLGLLGDLATPLKWAILHWWRMSELSCDRCASIVTSPEVVSRFLARFSGGSKEITSELNIREWAMQAEKYEDLRSNNIWDKTLQLYVTLDLDHPFNAVRVNEILKWGESAQYADLMQNLNIEWSGKKCPNPECGRSVGSDWKFCKYCGEKL